MTLPKEAVGIINYVFLDYEEGMILGPVTISYWSHTSMIMKKK